MEHNALCERQRRILDNQCVLPKKILSYYDHNAVAELVLHELCGAQCFNLTKAAYFIDNPDFNCLRGVAGYCRQNNQQCADGWCNPDQFKSSVQQDPFNQLVKKMQHASIRGNAKADQEVAQELAHDLGIVNPLFYAWNMKHDNHGLFIFEKADKADTAGDEFMPNGVCLLSFCPAFP